MDTDKIYSELKSTFPNLEIYQNHPLAPYTTIKIGGPADIFIHTNSSEELTKVLKFLKIENTEAMIFEERKPLRPLAKDASTAKNHYRAKIKFKHVILFYF